MRIPCRVPSACVRAAFRALEEEISNLSKFSERPDKNSTEAPHALRYYPRSEGQNTEHARGLETDD